MNPHVKLKVLIIEDNTNNHELFRDVFTRGGFEVLLRENADGFFIDDVAAFKPDIISMDLMMGKDGEATERDGFDALTQLKGDLRTHEIPVIILTSFFEEGKVRRAKELGAVDFISVPGQSMARIPDHYMRYLRDPKRYQASHPLFRDE